MSRFCSLRSLVALCALSGLLAIAAAPVHAQGLDLSILDQLEAPPDRVFASAAPLDLSSLEGLDRPLTASALDLSSLKGLEPAAKPVTAPKEVAAVKASPPAVVPATTMPAGMVCVNGQCFRSGAQPAPRVPRRLRVNR